MKIVTDGLKGFCEHYEVKFQRALWLHRNDALEEKAFKMTNPTVGDGGVNGMGWEPHVKRLEEEIAKLKRQLKKLEDKVKREHP